MCDFYLFIYLGVNEFFQFIKDVDVNSADSDLAHNIGDMNAHI